MKKILTLAAVTALAGLSSSANAWWGVPYGGYPYWGGYAPVVAAPVATVSQEQLNTVYSPRNYGAINPWGYDPFISGPGDVLNDPLMPPMYREMFRQSDAERQLTLKDSQARREAFHARTAAQRAAMDARRQAWRNSVRALDYASGYGAPFGYGRPLGIPAPIITATAPAAAAEQPAAAAQAPAAAPATTPQPETVAAAPAPAAQ